MTRIIVITREAFEKFADEEQQTRAAHGFCEGLKNRTVANLVASKLEIQHRVRCK